jgi:glycosyltransferase involved in cell wall biosynthesis
VAEVTAVIVNFRTLHLVKAAHESLAALYHIPIVLVDNASGDESTAWVRERGGICNATNIGHGPALHQAISGMSTRYVLTFDSDCVANKPGFIEAMLEGFADPLLYAVGWLRWVDRWSGVPLEWHVNPPPKERFVAYVHPAVALYDLGKYRGMAGFIQHGAPALQNMLDAEKRGYTVRDFPVFDYVTHLEAGTRRMYDGRWDPTEKERPKPWVANQRFPI